MQKKVSERLVRSAFGVPIIALSAGLSLFFVALLTSFTPPALGSSSSEQIEPTFRRQVWLAGTTYRRFFLDSGEDRDFHRGNMAFNFGWGMIDRHWLSLAQINLMLGPYENYGDKGEVNLDYYGNGFSLVSAYTVQRGGFRRPGGSFGLFFGLDYIDMIGRSVGSRNQVREKTLENTDDPEQKLIRGFSNQIYHFSFTSGFIYTLLRPQRPSGNSPELLRTTLEGLIVMLGVDLPLSSKHRTKYERTRVGQEPESVTSKGPYQGHSFIISIMAPLGI